MLVCGSDRSSATHHRDSCQTLNGYQQTQSVFYYLPDGLIIVFLSTVVNEADRAKSGRFSRPALKHGF